MVRELFEPARCTWLRSADNTNLWRLCEHPYCWWTERYPRPSELFVRTVRAAPVKEGSGSLWVALLCFALAAICGIVLLFTQ